MKFSLEVEIEEREGVFVPRAEEIALFLKRETRQMLAESQGRFKYMSIGDVSFVCNLAREMVKFTLRKE